MLSIPKSILYLVGGIVAILILYVASEYWAVADGVSEMLPGG